MEVNATVFHFYEAFPKKNLKMTHTEMNIIYLVLNSTLSLIIGPRVLLCLCY